mmetsp:Transcript_32884/g.71765  ORF Transcript_32884/g.71765 Transcript_32884/m.71765 type:complete len:86 (+) Transcript_32884:35-292(+)
MCCLPRGRSAKATCQFFFQFWISAHETVSLLSARLQYHSLEVNTWGEGPMAEHPDFRSLQKVIFQSARSLIGSLEFLFKRLLVEE